MPEFMMQWIKSLTDDEADQIALWLDAGAPCEIESIINSRPALYEQWNVNGGKS